MQENQRLCFAIHELNPYGGHDRSTLEVARRLSKRFPVDLCVYSFEDPEGVGAWGSDLRLKKIKPKGLRPAFLSQLQFQVFSPIELRLFPFLKGEKKTLVHSTGTCTSSGDIFQVQYIQKAWKKILPTLNPDYFQFEKLRGKTGLRKKFYESYRKSLLEYNVVLENILYSEKKKYIAISDQVKADLVNLFSIPEGNIRVIRHGVNPEEFISLESATEEQKKKAYDERAALGLLHDDFAFLFVGSFERKGLYQSIAALSQVKSENGVSSRPHLLVAGSGDESEFLRVAKSYGVQDQLRFLGARKDIDSVYRMADAFLMPTLYEPFGLVVIEAMASGLCPVVSKGAGASEMITDSESGLLISDPQSVEQISAQMKKLFLDRGLSKSLGQAARQAVSSRNWDVVASEYADFIESL